MSAAPKSSWASAAQPAPTPEVAEVEAAAVAVVGRSSFGCSPVTRAAVGEQLEQAAERVLPQLAQTGLGGHRLFGRLAGREETLVQALVELLEIVERAQRESDQLTCLLLDFRRADRSLESGVHRALSFARPAPAGYFC